MTDLLPLYGGTISSYRLMFVLLLIVLVIGLLIKVSGSRLLLQKYLFRWCVIISVLGILIYLFRFERVQYFDLNIWIFGWLAVAAVSMLWIIAHRVTRVPEQKKAVLRSTIKQKYLPKPKKIAK